nr:hypothetical protein [Nostoc sp. PA-18-2419]
MERQADTLGTRLIVAIDYIADGLRNLMVTLEKQQKILFQAGCLRTQVVASELVI